MVAHLYIYEHLVAIGTSRPVLVLSPALYLYHQSAMCFYVLFILFAIELLNDLKTKNVLCVSGTIDQPRDSVHPMEVAEVSTAATE